MTYDLTAPSVGEYFVIGGVVQCTPGTSTHVAKEFEQIFQCAKEMGQPSMLGEYRGPYSVFGQYDLAFFLYMTNLAKGMRFFFDAVDLVNRGEVFINDFMRIIGFTWDGNPETDRKRVLPPLAYTLLKYRYPADRIVDPDPATNEAQTLVVAFRKKLEAEIKRTKIELTFEIFGGLSWDEISVLFFGGKHSLLADVLMNVVDSIPALHYCRSLPLVDSSPDIVQHYEQDADTEIEVFFNTKRRAQVSYLDKLVATLPADRRLNLGYFDYSLRLRPGKLAELLSNLDAVTERLPLRSCTSIMSMCAISPTGDTLDTFQSSMQPSLSANIFEEIKQSTIVNKLRRIDEFPNVSTRKIQAIHTEINILRKIEEFRYIVPERLPASITLLLSQENISEATLQFYITEMRLALHQRLAGSQLGVNIGKNLGFFERFGGYQRILLACESLLTLCYRIFMEQADAETEEFQLFGTAHTRSRDSTERDLSSYTPEVVPLLLVFFDYGAGLLFTSPADTFRLGLRNNIPILIRLPQLKYSPHMWILGLTELGKWLNSFFGSTRTVQLASNLGFTEIANSAEVNRFTDNFISLFITKENYKKLLIEQFHLYKKTAPDRYTLNVDVYQHLEQRLASITTQPLAIDRELIETTKKSLLKGRVVDGLADPATLIAMLNAYLELSDTEKLSPKPYVAFTLSLYWYHPAVRGEQV